MKKKYDEFSSNRERNRFISKKSKTVTNTVREHFIPWEETNGTVLEIYPKFCKVRFDVDHLDRLCTYRRAQVWQKRNEDDRSKTPMTVGDRVKAKIFGSKDGLIEGVAQRKNEISRPAAGREGNISQVIAANIDCLVIVASLHDPDFSPGFIDRFLIAAIRSTIPTLLCINKADLKSSDQDQPWKIYQDLGFECLLTSAKSKLGLEDLKQRILGKTVVFCGNSGVGKTSLLNVLIESYSGKVGDVNTVTGKGKHTTTSAKLLDGPSDSAWIDTPGIRNFSMRHLDEKELKSFFPEFDALACTQKNCLHEHETDCDAKNLVRYPSYLKILETIRQGF